MKAVLTKEDIETLRRQDDKISTIVASLLDFFADTHVKHFGFKACPIHDALCVGILIDESLIEFKKTFVDISLHDPLTVGETVADLWGITGHMPNCHIAVKVVEMGFDKRPGNPRFMIRYIFGDIIVDIKY